MTSEELEVEVKLAVDAEWTMPDLCRVDGVAHVAEPEELSLEATYLDTADLRLLRGGTSLRRRTGDAHPGWHLKLPVGGDRREIRAPDADSLPPELAALVRARSRGQDLAPVATLRTRRVSRRLSGVDGTALAEVTDDSVAAEVPASATEPPDRIEWREVEVELVDGGTGDRDLLTAVEGLLRESGAQSPPVGSKVARALSARLKHLAVPAPPEPGPRVPVGLVVLGVVAAQTERITAADPAVRRDEPDAVHAMRVATRRLRSVLASYRSLLDRSATEPLRDELKWLADLLGAARDAEVLREHLLGLLEQEPDELVRGPVATRLDRELRDRYAAARAVVVRALDGDRYLALLRGLDDLVATAALTQRGRRPAERELDRRLGKEWRRLERHVRPALETGGDTLHEARKAAKRTRYAAELAAVVLGKPAVDLANVLEDVQDALGAHQDGVLARDQLIASAQAAQQAGEDGVTYGRLHAIEEARAREMADQLEALWHRAVKAARPWH